MKLDLQPWLLFYPDQCALFNVAHSCLGLFTACQCVFSLYKPHFRPMHFFLIFLFPKTKKQNTLVKIKTHVCKGSAVFILWLCHSLTAFLCTKKNWKRRKPDKFSVPIILWVWLLPHGNFINIWLLQFLPIVTVVWTEPSSKYFIMIFS